MEFRTAQSPNGDFYHLSGRLTFQDYAAMTGLIDSMARQATPMQIFDLSGLDYLDSSGVSMFIVAKDELGKIGKEFKLRGAKGQVKEVLQATQLQQIIPIET